ncbi:PE-PPE domain-containing protein [Mycobacterium sp.]|uniref:PE-PPE domain-containing protein n=1 Tax=Mycobacterium sp. TaxID=1785 RepID=UPI0025E74733|nr:PE-PPE domain-containing protein [Mycobacterium sp.]MBW0015179.1 PE-PPE domain-containing protein [Mycobacterium sp.]
MHPVNRHLAGAVAVGLLTWAMPFADSVAAADTALIVPGTAPSPYGPLRSLYHFNPAMQPEIGANYYGADATRRVIAYPGSFWPVTGLNSPTVDSSVNIGANNLDAAIRSTDGPISVAGLSQGTLALDREQARLAHDPAAPAPDRLTFIKAGDPNNLLVKAFGPGTHVPIIDYTVPAPVDSQYRTINVVGQYDPFSDPPNHVGNLLADLNAIAAGGYYGHSATAFSDPARVAPWDITTTTNSLGATTTTYFIRSQQLPVVRALVDLAGLPPEKAAPLEAVLRPMIDRAYNPGPAPSAGAFANGISHIPAIASAAAVPGDSITAATGSLTAANAARNVLSGPKAARGAKGLLSGIGRLLLRGRK